MKKRTAILALGLICVLFVGVAGASGGTAEDPLLSLSYLKGAFQQSADKSIDERLTASDERLLQDASAEWSRLLAAAEANVGSEYAASYQEATLKQGDILSGTTGLLVLVTEGTVCVQLDRGALVDITDGTELASGSTAPLFHRLLVAEDTTALFTVSSKAAVVNYCGPYYLARSSAPDYAAMADALKALTLFRGTGSAIGHGYELSRTPTRIEALVMLIRLLGEESAALSCTAASPFTDVDAWAVPYVAYAYEKGYSNGIGGALFGSSLKANAQMYTEFVLRALGYSSTAQSDISDAPERACRAGVITAGELAALQSGELVRADVTYLSYYALSAAVSGSRETLSDRLIAANVFTAAEYRSAVKLVTSSRLS